ncbi:hypothetical protein IWX90DRAFT_392645 [Phyllosticta citrichinensis]|uniref:Uncharacterized protein n=1 Tax=Phyllosticta citrichinensis TaxID=1130410 RepID=A0ABR1XH00_9PEZI
MDATAPSREPRRKLEEVAVGTASSAVAIRCLRAESICCSVHHLAITSVAPHLWLMPTQSSANISPLHRQRVKRRDIVLTEDPRLHLVWHDERIFVKPLPPYLLSAAFWEKVLLAPPQQQRITRAAFGLLCTYTHLTQHPSNLNIAHSHALLPSSITCTSFSDFAAHLSRIPDSAVSPRYAHGELRLSWLNVYAKVFLRRWYYFRLWPQYSTYFAQFYGPVLFVFGVLSVALGAMQVETAAEGLFGDYSGNAPLWVASPALVALIAVVLPLLLLLLLLWRLWAEWSLALRERWRKRGERRTGRRRGLWDGGDEDEDEDDAFVKGVV